MLEKGVPYKLKIKCEIFVSIAVCTNEGSLNYSPLRHVEDFAFLLTDPLYSFEVAKGDSGLPLWGNMDNECVHTQLPPFLAYLQDACTRFCSRLYHCKSQVIQRRIIIFFPLKRVSGQQASTGDWPEQSLWDFLAKTPERNVFKCNPRPLSSQHYSWALQIIQNWGRDRSLGYVPPSLFVTLWHCWASWGSFPAPWSVGTTGISGTWMQNFQYILPLPTPTFSIKDSVFHQHLSKCQCSEKKN